METGKIGIQAPIPRVSVEERLSEKVPDIGRYRGPFVRKRYDITMFGLF